MVRVEVPSRIYPQMVQAWPREAWAWSEVVPGRTYKVHYPSWETLKGLEAEKLLEEVRRRLQAARKAWR